MHTAKYSMDELQEAANKVNFDGFNQAGFKYRKNLLENYNLIGMKAPQTPEEEKIIIDNALESMKAAEFEMRKAMRVDPNDPVALKMFSDNPAYMHDCIFSNQRGFISDISAFDKYRTYLRSDLPVAGYSDYMKILNDARHLWRSVDSDRDIIENIGPFADACKEYYDRVRDLPPKGAGIEAVNTWKNDVHDCMLKVVQEQKKLANNLKFVEKEFPFENNPDPDKFKEAQERRKKQINEWNDTKNGVRNADSHGGMYQYRKDIEKKHFNNIMSLGDRRIREQKKYVLDMMKDMKDQFYNIGQKCAEFSKSDQNMTEELRKALKKAAKTSDPGYYKNPQQFRYALVDVETRARIAGNQEIIDWVRKNRAYVENKIAEADKNGAMTDEALYTQIRVHERNGFDQLDNALTSFTTKRAFFLKSETDSHKNLRENAIKLVGARNELRNMHKDMSNPAYVNKTLEVMKLADDTYKTAVKYIRKKSFSANSPAGKQRLAGAAALCREADVLRVALKKDTLAYQHYNNMKLQNQLLHEENLKVAEQDRIQQDAKRKASEKIGQIMDTNFNNLRSKLEADKPKQEVPGRKSVHIKENSKNIEQSRKSNII